MRTLFICILSGLTAIFIISTESAAAYPGALRQGLVESPDVAAVYVVDSNHTFVMGALPSSDEGRDFRVLGRYYGGDDHTLSAVMIEHGEEPVIYKGGAHGSFGALRSGAVRLARAPLSSSSDGEGYSSLDIFETATIACQDKGGHPLYVIPRKYGEFKRLTEVRALEAFRYILLKGATGVWFMACDGKGFARFQVLKNYDFINDGEEVVEFRQGLVMEDVNYVKNARAEAVRLAELARQRGGAVTSIEATVREIAALKKGFVRKIAGKRYYGSYKGAKKGRCAAVSLRRLGLSDDVKVTVVRDYRVCSGKVSLLARSETEESAAGTKAVYYRRGGIRVANSD